ncbi:hypothetical protein [Streptomyces sp. TRM49041]|uniref:hypothetical protein n=1 Tax=Streptomyces sp. TRM49041 TaxID=2603216 RepID=UPI0016568799|nr:hypothetical protein [Streptomyces sp. TRM49041]
MSSAFWKTCAAAGTGSLTAHIAGLTPLQSVATGAAVLVAVVLLKLLVLEWFSRKSDGVRGDVLKFACMLFLGQQPAPAESTENPGTPENPGAAGNPGAPGTSGVLETFGTAGTSGVLETFGTAGTSGVLETREEPDTPEGLSTR